jgi:hypothetical protein
MQSKAHLTIETLENMFVYLGCANIPTQDAMDGAIPIESLLGSRGETVSCLTLNELESMPPAWAAKAVWFSGEHLGLSTVENVHWSAMSLRLTELMPYLKMQGLGAKKSFTDKSHGFVRCYYSEIDRFGSFVKFPIQKKHLGKLVVKRLFNPAFLLEFIHGEMRCITSESDSVFREKGLSFLAPFMCGLAQSLRSYWLVRTRFDQICPSLTLLTDATGVKEFWKLRDVPPGRSRRAALLHWVDQHWRQMRNDPDVESFVRKHMRGSQALTHGSFTAEITPSELDTIDAERAKADRKLMKDLGADRRRRRKLLRSAGR